MKHRGGGNAGYNKKKHRDTTKRNTGIQQKETQDTTKKESLIHRNAG
jgi:hypothetical protein